MWIVVIAIFLSTAFIAAILDFDYRHTKDTDFLDDVPLGRNVAHFLYLSAVTLTGHGSFRPYSAPGRLYMMTKAFCLLILWACYRAALTAYFVSPPYPKQYVSTIMDFLTAGGTGAPACITDDPFSHNFFVVRRPLHRRLREQPCVRPCGGRTRASSAPETLLRKSSLNRPLPGCSLPCPAARVPADQDPRHRRSDHQGAAGRGEV